MREIPLTQGKIALVSDKDYVYLKQFKWQYNASVKKPKGYAKRRAYSEKYPKGRGILMHKEVAERMGLTGRIDHRNINSLDNQRRNLRKATASQNSANQGPRKNNTTGFKGVSKKGSKFKAQIKVLNNTINKLGFTTAIESAHEYDRLARKHFGKFAWTNFDKNGDRRSWG